MENTLAVKKNCSLVVQMVTWFAAVGTSLSQSSSGSGSRDSHHVQSASLLNFSVQS